MGGVLARRASMGIYLHREVLLIACAQMFPPARCCPLCCLGGGVRGQVGHVRCWHGVRHTFGVEQTV